MKSSNIGGQAVMEGIMMRHKDKYSIAVRRPDNEIELKVEDYKCVFGNAKFLKYPLIRGVVSFVDSLVVGTKCLMYSAEIAGDEEDEEDKQKNAALSEEELAAKKAKEDKQFKWLLYVTVAVSIVVSVAAFMLLPYALASLCRRVGASEFAVTIVEAFVKLALFMGYMLLISRMKDIQRTFMYHGAEHKCINCIEHGLELTVDMGEFPKEELGRILTAYSQKKKYYRLKSGQFLMLDQGGMFTLTKLAGELGISKKDLQSGTIRLPAYRALYLDHILKEGPGITYYRDQLFKSMVRAVKTVEDSDEPVPARFEAILREYQKTGFRWMKTLDKCGFGGILADDMGLGKTIQVIALFEDTYSSGEKAPSLVVCPASLVYNWEQEIQKFAPDLKVRSVVGTGPQRLELLEKIKEDPSGCQILITSYDLLKRDIAHYEGIDFRFQIIDEAQYIKNATTQSARSVKAVQVRSRFALTGTPIENRLGELWSIFDFLMPGFLFGNQYFRKEYEVPITKDRDEQVLKRLKGLIGPFILRRVKKDVLKELPDKLEKVVYSTLEEEQKKLYTANALLLKEKLEADDFKGAEKLQILSDLMQLRQICCDPRLCYGNYKAGSAKLKTCMDLIRTGVEGEHKILLFSQFTSMLDLIEEELKKEGIECYKLTGATPKEERIQMVSRFHQNEVPVFLISLKAGGTGLNLTAADIVIHYDPWWNVAAQNQATDRTHRIGQEKQVMVYKLITSDTIEENILNLQEAKRNLADQIVTGGGISFGELTKADILKMIEESRP